MGTDRPLRTAWAGGVLRRTSPRHARKGRPVVTLVLGSAALASSVLAGLVASGATAVGAAPASQGTVWVRSAHTSLPPALTIPSTATTTPAPPPPAPPPPAPPPPAPAAPSPTTTAPRMTPTTTAPPAPAAPAPGWGCAAALAYLAAHVAPGFTYSCPGPNDGQQATTTAYFDNGDVTGTIGIEDPCPAAYMNEAHNSWALRAKYLGTPIPDGLGPVIDPYGYCRT